MIDLLSLLTAREGRARPSMGDGAWNREARAVIAAATVCGISLREQDLVYLDVRDLQSLRWRMEHRRDMGRHPRAPRAA